MQERLSWPNPSLGMMYGNSLTEFFVILINTVLGLDIQNIPRHEARISLVNIVFLVVFIVLGLMSFYLFTKAKKSRLK